jgi:two-component system, cell cycle sensor histidine kinase and response regulator CckA
LSPQSAGGETILLVEDEFLVRNLSRRILEKHGYDVLEAADGEQALHVFNLNRDRIDLLLTDVIMPKMNGVELRAELAKLRPDLPALFMSGYTGSILNNAGVAAAEHDLIRKPFTIETLIAAVRAAIDDGKKN